MGRYGVRCNAVRPNAGTRMTLNPELKAAWGKSLGLSGPDLDKYVEAMLPPPEAISPLVVFLATDEAANVNGRTFFVSGGEVSLYTEPEKFRTVFKEGTWTVDELCSLMPKSVTGDLVNPSPPRE